MFQRYRNKILASVSDDQANTFQRVSQSNQVRNVAAQQLHTNPNDVHVLPLVHYHDGQLCETTIRNQQMIQKHEQLVNELRISGQQELTGANQMLGDRRNKVLILQQQLKELRPPQQIDPRSFMGNFDNEIAGLQARLRTMNLPDQHPGVATLKKEIESLQLTLRNLKPADVSSLQGEIDAQSKLLNRRIQDIDAQIANLGKVKIPAPNRSAVPSRPDIGPQLAALKNESNNLLLARDGQLKDLKLRHDRELQGIDQLRAKMDSDRAALLGRIGELNGLIARDTDAFNQLQNQAQLLANLQPADNIWEPKIREAQLEKQRLEEAARNLMNAQQQELNALRQQSLEANKGVNEDWDLFLKNEAIKLKNLKARLDHEEANTRVEVALGVGSTVPFVQKQVVQVPRVRMQPVETMESILVDVPVKYHTHDTVRLVDGVVTNEVVKQIPMYEKVVEEKIVMKEQPYTHEVVEEVATQTHVPIRVKYSEVITTPVHEVTRVTATTEQAQQLLNGQNISNVPITATTTTTTSSNQIPVRERAHVNVVPSQNNNKKSWWQFW